MSDQKFELSRRKAMIGLGSVGVASAGAGLGTSAYFSDEESFDDNSLEAGELDLIVDYETSYDQGSAGSGSDSGTVNGVPSDYSYELSDVKPGDSGRLVFCPKIVDNPAWLWVGSENGAVDYENGQTEPEAEIDETGAGSIGSPNDGEGEGELSESIQVTVSYCEYDEEADDYTVIREMNNPEDYTLADLASELECGFFVDGGTDSGAYPSSADASDQQGPCLCIDWVLPTDVGNEVQTDAVEFDFEFYAEQERHNENPTSPWTSGNIELDEDNSPGLEYNNENNSTEPYVTWESGEEHATFTFHNPTDSYFAFDYRVNGEPGTTDQWSGDTISEGPLGGENFGNRYNGVTLGPGEEKTVHIAACDSIGVILRRGAEQNWYIPWIRFDVE